MEPLKTYNSKQEFFRTMFVGTLIYSVVLGFFNDYTEILHTSSYSVTFAVAIVMQILTYLTFALKDVVKNNFKKRQGKLNTAGLVFSIWLILFLSKFIFLAVISFIFRESVEISGFIGLMLIIICMTLAEKLAEFIHNKLAS